MVHGLKKARYPQKLMDNDYAGFAEQLIDWWDSHGTLPDAYPNFADVQAALQEFSAANMDYFQKKQAADKAKENYREIVATVHDNLLGAKRLLTAFFGSKEKLPQFGLLGQIPRDKDKVLIRGQMARDNWEQVKSDPEFAAVYDFFETLAQNVGELEILQDEAITAVFVRQTAQNVKVATRAVAHRQERQMFSWYRGLHVDPRDEWWTESPWGRSHGKRRKAKN